MHKGSHMHTRAVWLSASHMQCLWRIGKVIRPVLPLQQKRKKKRPSYMKRTGNVWVTAFKRVCVCVCVCVCVSVCVCVCVPVWSSAQRVGDQCLVIVCLWLLSLSRLQLQLQPIKTALTAMGRPAQQTKLILWYQHLSKASPPNVPNCNLTEL